MPFKSWEQVGGARSTFPAWFPADHIYRAHFGSHYLWAPRTWSKPIEINGKTATDLNGFWIRTPFWKCKLIFTWFAVLIVPVTACFGVKSISAACYVMIHNFLSYRIMLCFFWVELIKTVLLLKLQWIFSSLLCLLTNSTLGTFKKNH